MLNYLSNTHLLGSCRFVFYVSDHIMSLAGPVMSVLYCVLTRQFKIAFYSLVTSFDHNLTSHGINVRWVTLKSSTL